jgi:hypothetical protein
MLAYSVVIFWYPSRRTPYYLKGGLGMLGPQIGAGLELPVGAHFSFIPYLDLLFASTGAEIKFNGNPFLDNASPGLFQIGLALERR